MKNKTQNSTFQKGSKICNHVNDIKQRVYLLAGEWVGDDTRVVPASGRLGETLQQQRASD